MVVDKKQRLVPGSMYIPPAPALGTSSLSPSSSFKSTMSPKGSSGRATLAVGSTAKALTPNKPLGELLRSLEPRFCFHPAVEELLLDMASDFVEDVVAFSSRLAKHRRSATLESKDLQFCLAKNYGISLVGAASSTPSNSLNPLGSDVVVRARPPKTSLHMHRVALKHKTLLRASAKLKKGGGLKVGDASGTKKAIPRKLSVTGAADSK